MKLSKEFKVGLLAVISGAILYLGFNFLKGLDFFSSTNTFYVVYDKVDGLAPSNPVTISGYPVGRVKYLKLMQERGNRILVAIDVNEDIIVGDSTIAFIAKDLLGSMSIVLHTGNNQKRFDNGDTLKGRFQTSLTEILEQKAYPVINHLDTTIVRLNSFLDEKMRKRLYGTMANFEVISGDLKLMLKANQGNIEDVTGNLSTLTANLVETEKQLKPILTKFSALADSLNDIELKQTVDQANQMLTQLTSITNKVNEGEGSLGALVNDKELYDNLNKTLIDLDSLLNHFDENPRHFLRPLGAKPKKVK